MKVLFGYLFLILSEILTVVQVFLYGSETHYISPERGFIVILITMGCLAGGYGSKDNGKLPTQRLAIASALLVCLFLIAMTAINILSNSTATSWWEYTALGIYIIAYGSFGFSGLDKLE